MSSKGLVKIHILRYQTQCLDSVDVRLALGFGIFNIYTKRNQMKITLPQTDSNSNRFFWRHVGVWGKGPQPYISVTLHIWFGRLPTSALLRFYRKLYQTIKVVFSILKSAEVHRWPGIWEASMVVKVLVFKLLSLIFLEDILLPEIELV